MLLEGLMGSNKFIIYLNYLKEMTDDDIPDLEDFTE